MEAFNWDTVKPLRQRGEPQLDEGLLKQAGIKRDEIPKLTRFAGGYFPRGCQYFIDGRWISEGGLIVAKEAFHIQEQGGQVEPACKLCRIDPCEARKQAYQPD